MANRLPSDDERQVSLTDVERHAVITAVRGSIDLYDGYVKLRAESPAMARKQGHKRRQLAALITALPKLRTREER